MKKGNPSPLSPALQAELEALAGRPDSDIDQTDPECPPMTEAELAAGGTRGALFRPGRPFKKPIAMRLDADVLDWFQRQGPGYQTRINAILREYMARHQHDRG
jgi:uncharacterized protein (DUF4415 family)